MVRRVRRVNSCPACMSVQEAYDLTALGGKVRPYFRDRDGRPSPGVVITEVLCWWCRERHHPDEVEKCMALPRKPAAVNGSASSTSKSLGAGLLSPFSELWGFLTTTQYEDGTKRQTGKLSVSCESGMLGLLLTDPETGQYAFLNGHSLDDLLLEAETRMGDGSLSWRPSRWQGKGRGK